MAVKADSVRAVLEAIQTTPIIDNHAHPLLKRSRLPKHPLLTIATEAGGAALPASTSSLAHHRAVNQLSSILKVEPTWNAVETAIKAKWKTEETWREWCGQCLSGISSVLVDDGLGVREDLEDFHWFDSFTQEKNKRIFRIEPFLEDLIKNSCAEAKNVEDAFINVYDHFYEAISEAMSDATIVGFKSVICYRTGLDILANKDRGEALKVFTTIHEVKAEGFERLDHKGLNDFFVLMLADVQTYEASQGRGAIKPIQFHTGLGDNEITLTLSSPAHLQPFIAAYRSVPIIMLHSGYPFVREAGYLAAMYANAYLDFGEVFPFLSREGQEGVVRQMMELTPASKLLFSTDGHFFPETYLLAVEQVREALSAVIGVYVRKGDLSAEQAIKTVQNLLFHNSNRVYNLGLTMKKLPVQAVQHEDENLALLQECMHGEDKPRFLDVHWCDTTATTRMRTVPLRRVIAMLERGEDLAFGITKAAFGMTQNDFPAEGISPSGEYRLRPDFSTLLPGPRKGHLSVRGDFYNPDGSTASHDPRQSLRETVRKAKDKGLEFLLGFEIELVVLRRSEGGEFLPLDTDGHAWSVARAMDHPAALVLEEAIAYLDEVGVEIEMIHAEAANGQYEVILPKLPPLEAIDTLLYTRDTLSSHLTRKGYKMTLHPKPFPKAIGTAAHCHMSFTSFGKQVEEKAWQSFYSGILTHLRAIFAFTCPSTASYDRAVDGAWAGGSWVAWGTQNREAALRKVDGSHWEMKCIDGTANPYLALSAVLSAGTYGIAQKLALSVGDCGLTAPAALTDDEKRELGMGERLPRSLSEALRALREDEVLTELLGEDIVSRFIAVKEAELEILEGMDLDERTRWIMERY